MECLRRVDTCGGASLDPALQARSDILMRVCRRWVGNEELGERIARRTLTAAWFATIRGVHVEFERSWLATVALNEWRSILRLDRPSGMPLAETSVDATADVLDGVACSQHAAPAAGAQGAEARDGLRAAIKLLPQPYQGVAWGQGVLGWDRTQTRQYLEEWRPGIRPQTARRIPPRAREMLRAALQGRDLRRIWPRRYQE